MALVEKSEYELRVINQMVDALSSSDRRRVIYLCGSLDTDSSVACVKEMLKSKARNSGFGMLLAELLIELKRFDILRTVCRTTKEGVDRSENHKVLPKFRVLMDYISEDIAPEDLSNVKFLLSNRLPREKMEKAKNLLDVVIELEKLDLVSAEKVDLVEECLKNINRVDLAKKVAAYKMSAPENPPVPVRIEQSCQRQLDQYKFNSNPRGPCVIIDCVGNDGDMLEQTFKALHFNVTLYKWLSASDTLSVLRGILRQRENFRSDCFVCCIISRGTENNLLGTDSYSTPLFLDAIRCLFTADSCPMMAGKPKLFFIQRYSVTEFQPSARMGHQDEDLETDGGHGLPRYDIVPTDADVFWSHCWTDERQLRDGHHQSFYLRILRDSLLEGQERKKKLLDIHTEMNGAIFDYNRRNPGAAYHIDLKHTLRKDFFF
ncbi:CASP8 and FADD-like apoptosis regulator [Toxotes jaculatrix]|uniref:CASP8 and FADD-like apoptosis regulator n=1 Tax=Toxotes jaculatrix TaxID=941984 RepID=UPI001B3ADA62|nr:CASP8 and FADD-like apoptosis regulator [Toxotes jaculatrix]XP_040912349.1 CASP8 and FADD-like apoptosis regulator [Toxotes jaculatrix]